VISCQNCAKGSLGCLGGMTGYWICEMNNVDRLFVVGITQCMIPARKNCRPKDCIVKFPGTRVIVLQKCAK